MIYSFDGLAVKYKNYTDIKNKIRREVNSGRLVQITRGLYETNTNTEGKYFAGVIYGPSYLSFDYALSLYGLIPEATYRTYTSATFQKRKTKKYDNHYGTFTYRDVPSEAFRWDILLHEEDGYSYQIATPEKALCDKLYTLPPIQNLTEFSSILFNDLRIDETELVKLNMNTIKELAPLYHARNLNFLIKFINRMK